MSDKKKQELSEEELQKASGGLNVNITPLGGHSQTSPEGTPGTFGGSEPSSGGLDPLGDHDQAGGAQQRGEMTPREQ